MLKITRRNFLSLSAASATVLGTSLLPMQKANACFLTGDSADLLEEAFLYAFPLVIMDATKTLSTNTVTAGNGRAPINQFSHAKKLADASFRTVVTPNVDTVYTQAWLDLLSLRPTVSSMFRCWTHGQTPLRFWKSRVRMPLPVPVGRGFCRKTFGRWKFPLRWSGQSPVSCFPGKRICRMCTISKTRCS